MKPVKLFDEQERLECSYCRENLLENLEMGIVVFVESMDTDKVTNVYTCCKGNCDERMKEKRAKKGTDRWIGLTDLANPFLFLKNIMATMNNMQKGIRFNDKAFDNYKKIILSIASYVVREPTKKEEASYIADNGLPV